MSKFVPNSFQVPNAVIDELMAELSGAELKVYLLVLRKTKGWNKETDAISVSQFMESCNLSNRKVIDACNKLVELGLLEQKTGRNKIKVFSVKNYSCEESSLVKKVHSGSEESSLPVVKKVHTQNNNTKNTKQNNNTLSSEMQASPTSKAKKYKFSETDLRLAKDMFAKIRVINPNHKEPNFEDWANTIRLISERDGKSYQDIFDLFCWANQDDFWKANILSPSSLREKWDKLWIKKSTTGLSKPRTDNMSAEWNTKKNWENDVL